MKDSGDLQKRVVHWLKNQGYPLEVEVASIFRKHKFEVSQGIYYSDPETTEAREIDVIAFKGDFRGLLGVLIVLECKMSKDKPWVLFTSEERGNRLFTFGILSDSARKALADNVTGKKGDPILKLPWFRKPDRNGHGMTAALGGGGDPAYKALLSALKASIYCVHEQPDRTFQPLRFAFPVIVLDGRLFEARLDSGGDVAVKEINEGFVTLPRTIAGHPCCSVHVVTRSTLDVFCAEALEVAKKLETTLKPELERLWKDWRIGLDMHKEQLRVNFKRRERRSVLIIRQICFASGYDYPEICTPQEFMGVYENG